MELHICSSLRRVSLSEDIALIAPSICTRCGSLLTREDYRDINDFTDYPSLSIWCDAEEGRSKDKRWRSVSLCYNCMQDLMTWCGFYKNKAMKLLANQ